MRDVVTLNLNIVNLSFQLAIPLAFGIEMETLFASSFGKKIAMDSPLERPI
ncbi:MAG: hypothetical protein JWN56_1122 [Sphingobacteriales bacterium]|nr:hypothetical protein [Sphingobacteriales bacterium]